MDTRTLMIGCLLVMTACAGPQPTVDRQSISVARQAGFERVAFELRNRGGGHGEVQVEIMLVGIAGHRIEATRTLELAAHEQLQVVIDVPAPADAYTVSVDAKYPD